VKVQLQHTISKPWYMKVGVKNDSGRNYMSNFAGFGVSAIHSEYGMTELLSQPIL
jgi:hypothetical protein